MMHAFMVKINFNLSSYIATGSSERQNKINAKRLHPWTTDRKL